MASGEMHYIIIWGDDLIEIMQNVQRPWLLNYRSWESHAPSNSCRTAVPSSSLSYEAFGIQHDPWKERSFQQQKQSVRYLPAFIAKELDFWWAQTVVQTALSLPGVRNSLMCRVNTLLFLSISVSSEYYFHFLSITYERQKRAALSRKLRR